MTEQLTDQYGAPFTPLRPAPAEGSNTPDAIYAEVAEARERINAANEAGDTAALTAARSDLAHASARLRKAVNSG